MIFLVISLTSELFETSTETYTFIDGSLVGVSKINGSDFPRVRFPTSSNDTSLSCADGIS